MPPAPSPSRLSCPLVELPAEAALGAAGLVRLLRLRHLDAAQVERPLAAVVGALDDEDLGGLEDEAEAAVGELLGLLDPDAPGRLGVEVRVGVGARVRGEPGVGG